MKKDIAEKWVAALRSGEYTQAKKALSNANGFCCLGVLCEIYRKETGDGTWLPKGLDNSFQVYFPNPGASTSGLVDKVREWAEIEEPLPSVFPEDGPKVSLHLLNDRGTDFDVIADLIEANAENVR